MLPIFFLLSFKKLQFDIVEKRKFSTSHISRDPKKNKTNNEVVAASLKKKNNINFPTHTKTKLFNYFSL